MPEPSGVDGNGNDMANTQRPRPRPRLSLVISRNEAEEEEEDEEKCSLTVYENIADGWCLSSTDDNTDENKNKKDVMSGVRKDPPRGGVGSSLTGVRRSTIPLSPSTLLHSNIPVPRRVSSATSSVNGRNVYGSCSSRVGGGGEVARVSTSTTTTTNEGGTLKCMPYNSPRPVPKSTRSNGHTNSVATKPSFVTNSRQSVVTPKQSSNFRGFDNFKRLNQSLLQPESKKLSVSAGALQSSSVTSTKKTTVIMRENNNMKRVPLPLCRGGSVDVLNDTSSRSNDSSHILKTEYRKSVSIPPRLVANMTSKFNALIEKNHFGSGSNCEQQRTEVNFTECSPVEVPLFTASHGHERSPSTLRSSSSSSLIISKICSSSSSSSRIQRPKLRQCLMSSDTGYVSANDDNESSETEILEKDDDEDDDDDDGDDDKRQWLRTLLKPMERTRDSTTPEEEVSSNESKPSSVKQAIRKYEVALMKNSTSSPELQRKPSLLREAAAVVATSRQSKTLPPTVDAKTMQNAMKTTNNGVATLPNTPFRSSFRTSGGANGSFQSSVLSKPIVNSGYGLTKPSNGHEAAQSSTIRSSEVGTGTRNGNLETLNSNYLSKPTVNSENVLIKPTNGHETAERSTSRSSEVGISTRSGKSQVASMPLVTPGSPPVTALRTLFNYNKSNVEHKDESKMETVTSRKLTTEVTEVTISPLGSPKAPSANSRGKMLFQKRATRCVEESIVVSTNTSSGTNSRTSSLDRALSSTLMGSMDLLAEIDNHPSLLPVATQIIRPVSTASNTSSSAGSSVAPNTSFLWKESTQCQVSQEKKNSIGADLLKDQGSKRDSSVYDELDEPIYEELGNSTTSTTVQTRQLSRRDLPLPLPDYTDDFSFSSPDNATSDDVAINGGESVSLEPSEVSPVDDNDGEAESDESWVDDDSDSDGSSAENTKSSTLSSKTRSRTKRQNGRRICLVRRSWSQSLRDLAGSHSNEGTALEDLESAGWEEGFGSDESSENAQSTVAVAKSADAAASSSSQTDSDDKSPVSINSEEASDNKDTNGRGDYVKDRKGKKVKRNWSWSKSDFKLDLSSKLGKIRLTNNQKKQQQQEFLDKGVVNSQTDVSPTKKKQWTFKAKFSTKKNGGPLSPKRSPVKENAQFYVPTYNADGTLATSPCCEALPSMEKPTTLDEPLHRLNEDGQGTGMARKARRVSSCGTLSRPKTAPPAPPVTSVKFADESPTCGEPPPLPPPNLMIDEVYGRDSKYRSSVSLDHGSVYRSNESEKSSIGYSHKDLGKMNSVSSENVDVSIAVMRQKRTSSSTVSVHSGSSTESYAHSSNLDIGVPSELFNKLSDGQQEAAGERVVSKKYSSLEREQQIGQLEFTRDFAPEPNRMSKLSPFEDEPLYQFYNIAARQRAARENQEEISDLEDDGDTDSCYESISQFAPQVDSDAEEEEAKGITKTSAMDLVRSTIGGTRTLWCEVSEVRLSGILDSISPQKRKLQEAMFEVITSEASYLKSLNVLVECFVHCPQLSDDYSMDCVLNKRERHVLFSDVIPVKETSERLLVDLENRWQESIVISDICDILQEHATKHFDVYVKYCSNQIYQDRCLKKLKEENSQFIEVLQRLEANPVCQNLSMYSFLMLPMQRITRLPLLVDAIFNRLEFGTKQYETCKQALATLNKIVHECNEGAHRMERMEEMLIISRQMDFRDCKCLALISASRWLVKKGDLTRLTFGDSTSRLSFGRRCAKQSVYLFLFTDLLIVAKKKSDDCYNVLDYCPRNLVHAVEIESPEQLPGRTHDGHRNIFQLSMLQNHDNKTVEMFFSCPKESDLTRWVEAVTPRKSENPGERIYEEWDCPQVQALHAYVAQQPDELSLEESDVVNVFRKITDGWYQGERIRDGVQGWFPSNYTVEIVSSHIRARNLRQRYRLLALSHSYVENQRKKEQNKGK